MIISAIIKLLSKIFLLTGKISKQNAFLKPLSAEEERECFLKAKAGDKDAEEKLIGHNLRLVAHIAKKYKGNQIDLDELISVGSIGLMKAVKSFDIDKGHSFSTYASRCIQNEILMLYRSQKKFLSDIPISEPIGTDKDGNEITLIDVLQDSSASVEDTTETKILFQKLKLIIDKNLTEREKEILYLRYGIYTPRAYTQNEIAQKLGISRSYISRIEKKVIEELREKSKLY